VCLRWLWSEQCVHTAASCLVTAATPLLLLLTVNCHVPAAVKQAGGAQSCMCLQRCLPHTAALELGGPFSVLVSCRCKAREVWPLVHSCNNQHAAQRPEGMYPA
jgi:hypothetical protein